MTKIARLARFDLAARDGLPSSPRILELVAALRSGAGARTYVALRHAFDALLRRDGIDRADRRRHLEAFFSRRSFEPVFAVAPATPAALPPRRRSARCA